MRGARKKCASCGVEFERKHCTTCGVQESATKFARRKYCSTACFRTAHAAKPVTPKRPRCAQCSARVYSDKAKLCYTCKCMNVRISDRRQQKARRAA